MSGLPTNPTALPVGGVRVLLRMLETEPVTTGALEFTATDGRTATVWVDEHDAYAARMDGYIPPIVYRLRSAGACPPDAWDTILAMEPADVGTYALDVLNIPEDIIEAVHREVLLATVAHLYDWTGQWHWTPDATTSDYATSGIPLGLLASAVDERIGQWNALVRSYPYVAVASTIPHPGPAWNSRPVVPGMGGQTIAGNNDVDPTATPEMVALFDYVNGQVTIAQIAASCGFTRFEIARLLATATADGFLAFTEQDTMTAEDTLVHAAGVRGSVTGFTEPVTPVDMPGSGVPGMPGEHGEPVLDAYDNLINEYTTTIDSTYGADGVPPHAATLGPDALNPHGPRGHDTAKMPVAGTIAENEDESPTATYLRFQLRDAWDAVVSAREALTIAERAFVNLIEQHPDGFSVWNGYR